MSEAPYINSASQPDFPLAHARYALTAGAIHATLIADPSGLADRRTIPLPTITMGDIKFTAPDELLKTITRPDRQNNPAQLQRIIEHGDLDKFTAFLDRLNDEYLKALMENWMDDVLQSANPGFVNAVRRKVSDIEWAAMLGKTDGLNNPFFCKLFHAEPTVTQAAIRNLSSDTIAGLAGLPVYWTTVLNDPGTQLLQLNPDLPRMQIGDTFFIKINSFYAALARHEPEEKEVRCFDLITKLLTQAHVTRLINPPGSNWASLQTYRTPLAGIAASKLKSGSRIHRLLTGSSIIDQLGC